MAKFKRTVVDNASAPEYIRVVHREDFEEALNALYERSGGFEDESTIDGYCALMDLVDEHTVRIPLSAAFSDPVKVEGSELDLEEDFEETVSNDRSDEEPDEDDLSSHESDDISDDISADESDKSGCGNCKECEAVPFTCLSDIQFGKRYRLWINDIGWIESPVELMKVALTRTYGGHPVLSVWFEDIEHMKNYQVSADGYDCGWKVFLTEKKQDDRFDYLTVHFEWTGECGVCNMCDANGSDDKDKDSEK